MPLRPIDAHQPARLERRLGDHAVRQPDEAQIAVVEGAVDEAAALQRRFYKGTIGERAVVELALDQLLAV